MIILAPNSAGPLTKITRPGDAPAELTKLDKSRNETSHRWPQFLPDGKHFRYLAFGTANAIFIGSLDPEEPRKLLLDDAVSAAFYAEGHLLFSQGDDLVAQPFDAERLSVRGTPFRLLENVASDPRHKASAGWGISGFSVSANGRLAYRTASSTSVLAIVDRASGKTMPVTEPGFYIDPAISPDGTRAAFAKRDSSAGTDDIWILDLSADRKLSRFIWSSIHSFAVLPREQRFLINVRDERASPITVILNWPALLQR